jgi:hypothetical protein
MGWFLRLLHDGDVTVVIAVAAVGVMQVPVDEVVDVVAMGHSLVPAIGAMNVGRIVRGAGVSGGAGVRVLGGHVEVMFVVVVVVMVVHVAVMQIVGMVAVENGGVSASGPVNMDVVTFGVNLVGHKPLSVVWFRQDCEAPPPGAARRRAPKR